MNAFLVRSQMAVGGRKNNCHEKNLILVTFFGLFFFFFTKIGKLKIIFVTGVV